MTCASFHPQPARTPLHCRAVLVALAAVIALPGCASSGTYPSLARRDAERVSGSAMPVSPAPLPAAPPSPTAGLQDRLAGLQDRLAGLVTRAQAAHRRFMADRANTESLVARAGGASVASESWSLAAVALADLEASRSNAMIVMAELDSLHAADAIAHFDNASGDAAALAAARDQVMAMIGEQDAVLAVLRARLRS